MSSSATPSAAWEWVYFYGVISGAHNLDDIGAVPIGGDGRVYGISYDGLTGVVSDATQERFALRRKNMLSHEEVVEAVMAHWDILPARFGHQLPGRHIVVHKLKLYGDEMREQLERVAGCVEIGVKVSWTTIGEIFNEITGDDPRLAALRDRMVRRPTRGLQMQVGERVAKAITAKRGREADVVISALSPIAVTEGVVSNETIEDEMVANLAFLVDRDSVDTFGEAVGSVDARCPGRYRIQITEPLPPYNFVDLHCDEDALAEPEPDSEEVAS